VDCLKGVFENFFRFNEILCINPEQESSYPKTQAVMQQYTEKQSIAYIR